MKRFVGFIVVFLVLMGAHVIPAHAADFTVCTIGCTHTTITGAIAAASNGDTITVMDAVHTEQGIVIDKNLTIQGQGAANTIVQAHATPGSATDLVFDISSGMVVTIQNMTIRNGNRTGSGGGIDNSGGTVTINNSVISGNSTNNSGGGIYSTIGSLTVNNSTISGNSARTFGGGIRATGNGGIIEVNNSTISGNSTIDSGFGGGGIYVSNGTATINYSTLSGNSTPSTGGGLYTNGSNVTVMVNNSIIANSASGGDCQITLGAVTASNTLVESTGADACSLTNGVDGNIIGSDPLLGALADNSGSTFTHALLAGSPAIDQIPTSDPDCNPGATADQRGAARANEFAEGANNGGFLCDVGAFEFDSGFTPTAVTNLQTDVTPVVGQDWLVGLLAGLLGVLTTAVVKRRRHS